uniref:Uncharacterized protein n=1 Tax=Panagrolaimus superbus TaxID=310955 RepID=A0A914Z2D0_9BILA
MPESQSILRQLLLSNDESDPPEGSQRKRKNMDDNEMPEKRRNIDTPENGPTAFVTAESTLEKLIISIKKNQRLVNPGFARELAGGFDMGVNNEQVAPVNFSFGPPPRQMNGSGFSNNSSQPKEDDLPVTREMRLHYIQQLRERLSQDTIDLPQ